MVVFFVIVVLVFAITVSDSSNKKKREEEYQKVKTEGAAGFRDVCRVLEALDMLEDVLKAHDRSLHFYRHIAPYAQTYDTVFKIQYIIIKSSRNPFVKEAIDSIWKEESKRHRIARERSQYGHEMPSTLENPDDYTVWNRLTDEQVELLGEISTLDQRRDEDNDIVLEGSLILRCDSYPYKVKMYIKALSEAIHEKFPDYGFEASSNGIRFNDKNGVISYKDI